MIVSTELSRALTQRFGLSVNAKTNQESDGYHISIFPADIEKTISFININLN